MSAPIQVERHEFEDDTSTQIEGGVELTDEEKAALAKAEEAERSNAKTRTAYKVLQYHQRRWPTELQPMAQVPPRWGSVLPLAQHRGSALVVVPGNVMTGVLWTWFAYQGVKVIKELPQLSSGMHSAPLPRMQITSSRALIRMTFGGEGVRPPYDWVNPTSELVAVWLDSGAPKHEASVNGLIDIINASEMHSVPLWIGCSHKWRYGSKHALRHERIDEWMESVPLFEVGSEGTLTSDSGKPAKNK
jgi:hypothetical protein